MTASIIIEDGRGWRPYRFPPRSQRAPVQSDLSHNPEAMERALGEGFQEGMEKGYQQGLAEGEQAGRQDGYAKGREEGLLQGREEGARQGRELFEQASQPLEEVSEKLRQFLDDFELKRRQDLLELVKKVSQQVIRCELTLSPTQLLALAEETLEAMPGDQGEVQVLLNPEECMRIKELAPERAAAWRLVADERLGLGECRIVTAHTETDIGCQQRLDSCVDTLSRHLQLDEE